MLNQESVKLSIDECIKAMKAEKRKTTEQYFDGYIVSVNVSTRQISIAVYTTKPNPILPLPMVDEEYAMVCYDLKSHSYVRENNSDMLKPSVRELNMLNKTGELHIAK